MPVTNDQELAIAVAQASSLVQDIHNYCGRTLREDAKISFPRGLIGTAESYRSRCPGYLSTEQASSCAYAFMYLDVLWWLLSRTDIAIVGRCGRALRRGNKARLDFPRAMHCTQRALEESN